MKRWLVVLLTLTVLMASAGSAQKRKENKEDATKRSVQGTVMNASDNVVSGAIVQLKDPKTLQIRSFITKTDGSFHFYGLSRNLDYELKAEHEGAISDVKTLSSFDGRSNAVINLKVEPRN
jgi:hypothetical protein